MPTNPNKPSLARPLLILGRVSNLPTVWSNCLAGWLLGGGGEYQRFGLLCAGASLLYIGGMFLNDACDVHFDMQHRSERPIPSGAITARTVWVLSFILLAGGASLLAAMGKPTMLVTLGLLVYIVAYDLIHKRTTFAPLLMAGCRFLLYLVAATTATGGITSKTLWCAGSLAVYIIGLSYIARRETERPRLGDCLKKERGCVADQPQRTSLFRTLMKCVGCCGWSRTTQPRSGVFNGLAVPLLAAPVLSGCMFATPSNAVVAISLTVLFLVWVIWSLRQIVTNKDGAVSRVVSCLLAGIVLVDMLAVQGGGGAMPLVFVLLFISALILQRKIPAT